jgi:uncharacterized protein
MYFCAVCAFEEPFRLLMSMDRSIKVISLYRYPVKGLSPQPLEQMLLTPGETVPDDRIYAIENGFSRFDPEHPRYLPKINFVMRMRNDRLAALTTTFDNATHILTIFRDGKHVAHGALNTKLGRQLVEQFFAGYLRGELKGPPRILHAENHSFSDIAAKSVHFVNLATVRELEETVGKPLAALRFRANVYFDGAPGWQERKWLGRVLKVGTARLRMFEEAECCDGTNVNPESGERDVAIPPALQRTYNHVYLGFYAEVIEAGEVHPGDTVAVED